MCEPLEISISNYVKPVPGPKINNWYFMDSLLSWAIICPECGPVYVHGRNHLVNASKLGFTPTEC